MKYYTNEERALAKTTVPKVLADFVESEDLRTLYLAIQKKNNLNLRQIAGVMCTIEACILGLEPFGTLEPALQAALPELSKDALSALVKEIDDEVFKKARDLVQKQGA